MGKKNFFFFFFLKRIFFFPKRDTVLEFVSPKMITERDLMDIRLQMDDPKNKEIFYDWKKQKKDSNNILPILEDI